MSLPRQVGVLVAVLAVVTLAAEALGAANLGTALSFGQMAFVLCLVALLLRS